MQDLKKKGDKWQIYLLIYLRAQMLFLSFYRGKIFI